MKYFWYSIKTCFKASPFFCILHILLFSLFAASLGGVLLSSQGNLIDGISRYYYGNEIVSKVVILTIIYLAVYLVRLSLYNGINQIIAAKIHKDTEIYIQEKRIKKLLSIKYEYYEQDSALNTFEKSEKVPGKVHETYMRFVWLISELVGAVSYNVALFTISPILSYICTSLGVISAIIIYFRSKVRVNVWYVRSKERRMLDTIIGIWQGENLTFNQSEQRVFMTGDKMSDYTYKEGSRLNKKITDKAKLDIFLSFIAELLATAVSIAIVILIVIRTINGSLAWSIGEVTIAITGYAQLIRRFTNASNFLTSMFVSSKEVVGMIELEALEEEDNGLINEVPEEKIIHVKNLCFTYPGTEKEILHNVTFDMDINEHIAFVGRNGSGKSTMVKLLLGLYEPTSGEITIGGHNIRDYSYEVRRKIFGVQFQDFVNYPFKIRETVAVGNSEIINNDEEIERILKEVNIYDAILSKDATLDTLVRKEFDDNAIEFSGGEKQRISLATTMAYDHDHLVLDEPTAALDAMSENKMYESFMSGIKNKGSLIVSHRLASARISDRILVFENGEITQDGNHNELIKEKDKLYYKMFTAQAKLYKKVQDEGNN